MVTQVIDKSSFKQYSWSSGKAVEMYISPPGTKLEERNFDFRISSAVCPEISEFSDFSGYKRIFGVLDNRVILQINGNEKIVDKYDLIQFDGSDKVISKGKCIDFNVMLSEGFDAICTKHFCKAGEEKNFSFLGGHMFIFAVEGRLTVNGKNLSEWGLAAITGDKEEICNAKIISNENTAYITVQIYTTKGYGNIENRSKKY